MRGAKGLIALAVLAATALSGCVVGGEEDTVADTYRSFLTAYGESDADLACPLLTPEAEKQFVKLQGPEEGGATTCEEIVSAPRPDFDDGYLADSAGSVSGDDVSIEGDEAELDTGLSAIPTPTSPTLPGIPDPSAQPAVPPSLPDLDAEFEREGDDWKISSVGFFAG